MCLLSKNNGGSDGCLGLDPRETNVSDYEELKSRSFQFKDGRVHDRGSDGCFGLDPRETNVSNYEAYASHYNNHERPMSQTTYSAALV